MENYQLRVVAEKAELEIKLNKLRAFIAKRKEECEASELIDLDLHLLEDQEKAMSEYAKILGYRIARF